MNTYKFSIASYFIIFVLASCETSTPKDTEQSDSTAVEQVITLTDEQQKSLRIQTTPLTNKTIDSFLDVTGVLDVPPQNAVSVSSVFGGYVLSTEMLQGKYVKKGQVLCEMQDPTYIQIQQEYLEARSKWQYLKTDYERQQSLAKEQANAQKTVQQVKSEYESARVMMEAAKAKLNMLNIATSILDEGKIQATIKLISPISGYVTQVNVNIGSYVQPKDVMFRIVDTEHLHAEIIVYEKDLPYINVGQKVLVKLPNEQKERHAHVYLVNKEIAADRTIRVHCHLDEEDPALIPGTYIQAQLVTTNTKAEAVLTSSIVSHEGRQYIFVTDASLHQFHYYEVESILASGDWSSIKFKSNRPDSGAQVVSQGAYDLMSKLKNTEEEE
jgi:cobalt-zinc-cadmium efflux system membrane fusion protein